MTGLRKPTLPTLIDAEPDWFDLVDFLGGVTTDPQIDATKMLLAQGGSLLSTWRHADDLSKIDAAKLLGDIAAARMQTNVLAGIIAAGGIVDADVAAAAGIVSSKFAAWPSTSEIDRILAAGLPFAVTRGGSGLATIAAGGILYASALNTLSRIAPTAVNQVLRSTAANALEISALLSADIPALDAAKTTSGTFDLARIPSGVDAAKLRTYSVQDHAPEDGEYLKWVAGNNRWEPASM